MDLYALRFYSRAFNAKEQLNNFICDRSTIAERIAADKRNDILDLANTENEEDIVISFDKVQSIIPVMIMRCAKLPENKETDKFRYYAGEFLPETVDYFTKIVSERFPQYLWWLGFRGMESLKINAIADVTYKGENEMIDFKNPNLDSLNLPEVYKLKVKAFLSKFFIFWPFL